jgi:DNA repair protein RadD
MEYLFDNMGEQATLPVRAFLLRDYQREDVSETERAYYEGRRAVIARAATGLGKSVMIAELAKRRAAHGRVMVVVDVGSLAAELASTISDHTGKPCGILTGDVKDRLDATIVVATVQTLYAKDRFNEKRYEKTINPHHWSTLVIDECESALADEFGRVVAHFVSNSNLKVFGTTATPFRTDGVGMGRIFDHASNEPGPLNRDILWGRDNGWLVKIKQAFVHVTIDFSTLKLKKDIDGVRDYSDDELSQVLSTEQAVIEMAKGIHHVTKSRPTIVICPSVDVAKLLAHHLCADAPGCAHAVYGELGEHGKHLISRFKRREFPILTSVNMLYKGFDADHVEFVVMARKTKSRRVYEQAMGRGTRPIRSVRSALAAAADPLDRIQLIATSEKPFMTMVDLVGIDENTKDLGVIDILGDSMPADVRQRTKKKQIESDEQTDPEDIAREAEKEIEDEKRRQEERERRKRQAIDVRAHIEVETTDNLRAAGVNTGISNRLPDRVLALLERNKVPQAHIDRLGVAGSKKLAQTIIARHKAGLCTYRQGMKLLELGLSREFILRLSKPHAKKVMDHIATNDWRPINDAVARGVCV